MFDHDAMIDYPSSTLVRRLHGPRLQAPARAMRERHDELALRYIRPDREVEAGGEPQTSLEGGAGTQTA